MTRRAETFLFGGPTLFRARAIEPGLDAGGATILPPVQRGDVTRIVTARTTPGELVIVDGLFHLQNLSVGHLEIRLALKRGWTVWGMSSMGAIRAAEMHHMGMQGFGAVFERYRDDPDFRDDEVALLHEPTPPYREATEPLIHIRVGLDDLVQRELITAADERHVLADLEQRWFGERTLPLVRELVLQRQPIESDLLAWTKDFNRFRVKAHDFLAFMKERHSGKIPNLFT